MYLIIIDNNLSFSSLMIAPPLSKLVYSLACFYLAIVGAVGFTANGFVVFLYCKSKKVSD